MATATHLLTPEEFRAQYAEQKPYFEYWFGQAIQKSVPTWLHALLQNLLCDLFREAGYKAAPELELRIDPDWQPKPDVAAAIRAEQPYPTQPIDIVAEVLSPEDRMAHVFEKCRQYERIGIRKVFVLDPVSKNTWEWSSATQNLERRRSLDLPNGHRIDVEAIWTELSRRQ